MASAGTAFAIAGETVWKKGGLGRILSHIVLLSWGALHTRDTLDLAGGLSVTRK
jgi:hypothetical protein